MATQLWSNDIIAFTCIFSRKYTMEWSAWTTEYSHLLQSLNCGCNNLPPGPTQRCCLMPTAFNNPVYELLRISGVLLLHSAAPCPQRLVTQSMNYWDFLKCHSCTVLPHAQYLVTQSMKYRDCITLAQCCSMPATSGNPEYEIWRFSGVFHSCSAPCLQSRGWNTEIFGIVSLDLLGTSPFQIFSRSAQLIPILAVVWNGFGCYQTPPHPPCVKEDIELWWEYYPKSQNITACAVMPMNCVLKDMESQCWGKKLLGAPS